MQSTHRTFRKYLTSLILLISFFQTASAQSETGSGSVYVIAVLVIIGALILVSAILTLSENLIQIEAQKTGIDTDKGELSLLPNYSQLWKDPSPGYAGRDPVHTLAKGFDIKLSGRANHRIIHADVKRFSVRPPDFRGLSPIPRLVVKEGDEVSAGDVLFHDKKDDRIKYVAPVSGEIVEIRRGDKRAINEVIILADKKIKYRKLDPPSISESTREELVHFMLESGAWTFLNQRPFDILPSADSVPENIFISTFDTAPLAPDNNFIVEGKGDLFQKGIDVLRRLTPGNVFLGLDANHEEAPSTVFTNTEGVKRHWFRGPHPSGNVGVQIHHSAPIRTGKSVWTLKVQEVITLGELFHKGKFNPERIIALTGARVLDPVYFKTFQGACVGDIVDGHLTDGKNRIIAGDILTGRKVGKDDFLDIRCDQLSVIEEGDYYEMFGWLLPLSPRPTISKSFPNFLFPELEFDGDTNTHGEKRAFVVTGEYEKVLPMKIYPQHLLKAIIVGDFEMMEGLGIYELSEEDLALCEFACTSKMPLQQILRDGLDMMREQT